MSLSSVNENLKIVSIDAKDMRWPTSLGGHGSDAMVNPFTFISNEEEKSLQSLYKSKSKSLFTSNVSHFLSFVAH